MRLLSLFAMLLVAPVCALSAFQLELAQTLELPCPDCDGIALGDINGNGKTDILASSGKNCEVFWFEQGDSVDQWRLRPIYRAEPPSGEFEGNDLADFDGDGSLEAISLNQPQGKIYLHKQQDLDGDLWDTAVILEDRPFLQCTLICQPEDNARPALLYTWEGDAPGRGGVHLLSFSGDDVLNPEHWRDMPITVHESAWWLAQTRHDLNGNGELDLVFSARNILTRNAGARPGLYWLEAPLTGETALTPHVIDATLRHPLHVDFGDFSGAGHGRDLAVGGFETDRVYWYAFDDDWKRHEIALPDIVGGLPVNRVWNVKSFPMPDGGRDALLVAAADKDGGALLWYEYRDGAYEPQTLLEFGYNHPTDDRIVLYDLNGNGTPEAFIPDSGPGANRLLILFFASSSPSE